MKYTQEQFQAKNYNNGKFYNVQISVGRWAKVGEQVEGRTIKFPKVFQQGKTILSYYFDNAEEALHYVNDLQRKIEKHNKAKEREPFSLERLMKQKVRTLEDNDRSWTDYQNYDRYPFVYRVRITYNEWLSY